MRTRRRWEREKRRRGRRRTTWPSLTCCFSRGCRRCRTASGRGGSAGGERSRCVKRNAHGWRRGGGAAVMELPLHRVAVQQMMKMSFQSNAKLDNSLGIIMWTPPNIAYPARLGWPYIYSLSLSVSILCC